MPVIRRAKMRNGRHGHGVTVAGGQRAVTIFPSHITTSPIPRLKSPAQTLNSVYMSTSTPTTSASACGERCWRQQHNTMAQQISKPRKMEKWRNRVRKGHPMTFNDQLRRRGCFVSVPWLKASHKPSVQRSGDCVPSRALTAVIRHLWEDVFRGGRMVISPL